jgi:hypothetical protein
LDRHTYVRTDIRMTGRREKHPYVMRGLHPLWGPMPKLDMKALMGIGSLCPISVKRVIKGHLPQGCPKGAEALSSHHI